MKNFLILFLLSFATFTVAQERSEGDIELVPYVGFQQSFINGGGINELNLRGAARFGVIGDYYFNDRWSLRSGLNYDSMGSNGFGFVAKFDYLNIPVNANWHFGSTRKWNLNFGLTSGFLLSGDIDGASVKDQMKGFQLGISYGVGYKLEMSENFSFLFDVQALTAVTNYVKNESVSRMNAGSSINVGAVFSL